MSSKFDRCDKKNLDQNLFIYEKIKKKKWKRSLSNMRLVVHASATRGFQFLIKKKKKNSTVCEPRPSSNLSMRRMDASLHRNRINLHCTAWWMFSWDIYVCIALSYLLNNWAGWSRIHRTHFMKKHFAARNRGKMPCSRRGVKFLSIFLKRSLRWSIPVSSSPLSFIAKSSI